MKQWTFTNTETTTATPEAIWRRWTNVTGWPEEDTNLVSAELQDDFAIGGKIIMKPKGAPKSSVKIVEMTPNVSFSTEGTIPLGKLIITHNVEATSGRTSFTHTITVTGPLRKLFVRMVVQKLANNLPVKMKNIARLAESA
ncbi:SRPBCC family protein [Candidatus Saccharibacteria bacterium]|nr:SRPBCC family protein [Candidatus Saccharibacteria bacterium]